MYWIKSTNDFSYNMGGHLIPKMRTPNNAYLEADENVYKTLKGIPVFNALVKSGGIIVHTKRPGDIMDAPDVVRQRQAKLEQENSHLESEIEDLKRQLAEQKADSERQLAEKEEAYKRQLSEAKKAGKKGVSKE